MHTVLMFPDTLSEQWLIDAHMPTYHLVNLTEEAEWEPELVGQTRWRNLLPNRGQHFPDRCEACFGAQVTAYDDCHCRGILRLAVTASPYERLTASRGLRCKAKCRRVGNERGRSP